MEKSCVSILHPSISPKNHSSISFNICRRSTKSGPCSNQRSITGNQSSIRVPFLMLKLVMSLMWMPILFVFIPRSLLVISWEHCNKSRFLSYAVILRGRKGDWALILEGCCNQRWGLSFLTACRSEWPCGEFGALTPYCVRTIGLKSEWDLWVYDPGSIKLDHLKSTKPIFAK